MSTGYSLAAGDLSLASGILKTVFKGDSIPSTLANHSNVYNIFAQKSITALGGVPTTDTTSTANFGSFYFPVQVINNRSMGSRAVAGVLPSGDSGVVKHGRCDLTYYYFSLRLSDQEIMTAKTNMGAYMSGLEMRRANILSGAKGDFDRQLFTSSLGKVESISGTTVIIDNDKYLQEGDKIDTYTSTSQAGDSITITAVSYDTNPGKVTCTFSSTTSVVVGDDVYREDAYGNEIVPLTQAISMASEPGGGGTTTYMNLSSSTWKSWASVVVDAATSAFNVKKHLWNPCFEANKRSGAEIDLVIMPYHIMTDYIAENTQEFRRIVDGAIKPVTKTDLGWSSNGLVFTNPATDKVARVVLSHHCPDDEIYGLSTLLPGTKEPCWAMTETGEPTFIPGETDILRLAGQTNSTSHAWERIAAWDAIGKYYFGLLCRNRAINFKVKNLAKSV